jgi:hypothetical protein
VRRGPQDLRKIAFQASEILVRASRSLLRAVDDAPAEHNSRPGMVGREDGCGVVHIVHRVECRERYIRRTAVEAPAVTDRDYMHA